MHIYSYVLVAKGITQPRIDKIAMLNLMGIELREKSFEVDLKRREEGQGGGRRLRNGGGWRCEGDETR